MHTSIFTSIALSLETCLSDDPSTLGGHPYSISAKRLNGHIILLVQDLNEAMYYSWMNKHLTMTKCSDIFPEVFTRHLRTHLFRLNVGLMCDFQFWFLPFLFDHCNVAWNTVILEHIMKSPPVVTLSEPTIKLILGIIYYGILIWFCFYKT